MSFSLSEVLYYRQLYFFFKSSLRVDAHSFNFDKFRDTAPLKQIKKTNLEEVVVYTCIRLLHLRNGSNYDFPIHRDDMLRCSVHDHHSEHHPAKSDLALSNGCTNHSSVCSRLLRNNQACGKWRSLHRFPSSHHISFPTCHLRTAPLFLGLK